MRNARIRVSISSEESDHDVAAKREDSQEMEDLSTPANKTPINSERRSRYSMNYQSYEATRIQPGEQTRRMLDYMFPGYQKRDPRNWYEMQTQTDLGFSEVNSLIGTELIEGEPIESYEDRKKSLGDSYGDDYSIEGSPAFEKTAVKKGHRSSIVSKAWEGPPIKLSGKSSEEGFHLEVDDYYHEPQTILVPKQIIEHQELRMDIVPDEQGIPKVIIYLGNKDPSVEHVKEQPESTIILYDGKDDFDGSGSGSEEEVEEEDKSPVDKTPVVENVPRETSVFIDEGRASSLDITAARDSLTVVPPTVGKVEPEPEPSITHSDDDSDKDEYLAAGRLNNSVFLEPIKATGSHADVFEDVIDGTSEPRSPETMSPPREPIPLKEPTPPPREPTPPPREPTPPPREPTPSHREPTPPPREPTPPPRESTPPPREPTPPPREPTPPPREPTPEPRELTPTPPTTPPKVPSESISTISVTPPPSPKEPSVVSVEQPEIASPPPSPEPVAAVSMPSQTNSHVGSPPDHLFGPLENYPNDLEEESDKVVHSPSLHPSPSKDKEDDHPLRLTDDYPPQYSPPPREASEVSNWLEDNILSEAKTLARRSPKQKSPQKSSFTETKLPSSQHEPDTTSLHPLAPSLKSYQQKSPQESEMVDAQVPSTKHVPAEVLTPATASDIIRTKPKSARFGDDETVPDEYKRPLEQRFSIYYPPPKPKKKKVSEEETGSSVPDESGIIITDKLEKPDDAAEENAVNAWLEDEILNPAAVNDWVDKKILNRAKTSVHGKEGPQSLSPSKTDSEQVDIWMEDEILKPAQIDKWVDDHIIKPGKQLSEGKGSPQFSPIDSSPSKTSSLQTSSTSQLSTPSVTPVSSSKSQTPSPPRETTELKMPAQMVPSHSPTITPARETKESIELEMPKQMVLPKEISVSSDKSIDLNEQEVDSWVTNEVVQPAQAEIWLEKEVVKPAQGDKRVSQQVIKPTGAQNYVDKQIMKPASMGPYEAEQITKPTNNQSYVDDQIIKPSSVQSYVDEEITKVASVQSYVDEQIMKPASVQSYVDRQIMKPASAQSYVEEQIMKPASIQSYVDQQIMKPASVQSYVDEVIIKPATAQSREAEKLSKPHPVDEPTAKPAEAARKVDNEVFDKVPEPVVSRGSPDVRSPSLSKHSSPETSKSHTTSPSKYSIKFPEESFTNLEEAPGRETPPTNVKLTDSSYDEKPLEPPKQFLVPETYISDTDLMGPFQPHPDCPDEHPENIYGVQPAPPKMEIPIALPKGKSEGKIPEIIAPSAPTSDTPDASIAVISIEDKSKPSPPKILEQPIVEKTPTDQVGVSLTSLDRKPSLKPKSERKSISKTTVDTVEPERKDRPSILAKKAMENNNYLLRDDDIDYVTPKVNSSTSVINRRRKSSTVSRKVCPLTNLFKKKKHKEELGPSLFMPPSKRKRSSSAEEDSESRLSSIDEEDFQPEKRASDSYTKEMKRDKSPNRKSPIFKTKINQETDQGEKVGDVEPLPAKDSSPESHPGREPSDSGHVTKGSISDDLHVSTISISTKTVSNELPTVSLPSPHETEPSASGQMVAPPLSQIDVSPPAQDTVPSYPQIAPTPIEASISSVPKSDIQKYEMLIKKSEPSLVTPEELILNFPKFPDHKEVMINQKKPTDKKLVPEPPKRGFPMFPDYKQLTEPQNEPLDLSPSREEHGDSHVKPKRDGEALHDETPSKVASRAEQIKIPSSPSEPETFSEIKEFKRVPQSSVDYPSSNTPKFQKEPEIDDIQRSYPKKNLENYVQDAAILPIKSSINDTSNATEPMHPGYGIPKFPDYSEITLGTASQPSKSKNAGEQWLNQIPTSMPKISSPPQQTIGQQQEYTFQPLPVPYSMPQQQKPESVGPYTSHPQVIPPTGIRPHVVAQQPTNFSDIQAQESTRGHHGEPSRLHSTSFKKYDYTQQDRPLQLISIPDPLPKDSSIHQPQRSTFQEPPIPQLMEKPTSPIIISQPQPTGPHDPQTQRIIPHEAIQPTEFAAPRSTGPPLKTQQELQLLSPGVEPYKQGSRSFPAGSEKIPQPPGDTSQLQAPSFKKYDYTQSDRPLQLVTSPDSKPKGSLGHMHQESAFQHPPTLYSEEKTSQDIRHPYGVTQPQITTVTHSPGQHLPQLSPSIPYSTTQSSATPSAYDPDQQQQSRGRKPDHQMPIRDQYISIKQRTTPQLATEVNSPYGQPQQGFYDPYISAPQSATRQHPTSEYSPYRPLQPQVHHYPFGTTPQSHTQPPPSSVYGPKEGPVQHQSPYDTVLPNSYRQPGGTTQHPSPQVFSPHRPVPQQWPTHAISSQRSKSPALEKHTYTEPEKPLPLPPVRPIGLEDQSPPSRPQREMHDDCIRQDGLSPTSQTRPVVPGGGIPRFQDYPSKTIAKPPTMKGDFSRAAPRPKTVTAADKRAEFDKEIFPIMQQIQDLKRQMYELTPQKGPPMRTDPRHAYPLPTSLQLYNDLERRTLEATKSEREDVYAKRRKQQYEESARRKIQRAIERSKQTK